MVDKKNWKEEYTDRISTIEKLICHGDIIKYAEKSAITVKMRRKPDDIYVYLKKKKKIIQSIENLASVSIILCAVDAGRDFFP